VTFNAARAALDDATASVAMGRETRNPHHAKTPKNREFLRDGRTIAKAPTTRRQVRRGASYATAVALQLAQK